eukprot:GHUV01039450.1.p1 GENE.GHUV01039450.1~~GHUV01039450.1.p1  ORF type:complete len:110 (+),score=23.14 GHUV01039450.1:160-489(+)
MPMRAAHLIWQHLKHCCSSMFEEFTSCCCGGSALLTVHLVCLLQTNVLSVAATPGLSYVVGGCMDSCVHIWQFSTEEGADKTELVEYSCGGYMTKVGQVDFNSEGQCSC